MPSNGRNDGLDPGQTEDEIILTQAVREAGEIAMGFFGRGLIGEHKADNTPVSEADLAVDRLLYKTLMRARPSYGWLSEETADHPARLDAEKVWIVDPIDGTRGFLAGSTDWTISAALVERGRPTLAAVYNPARAQIFTARLGAGARLNGASIKVRARAEIAGSRLIATRSFLKRKIWAEPWPEVEDFWVNSIAYRLALIAAGQADATFSLSAKSEWDLAAAVLLVQEAGGKATDAAGSDFVFNRPHPRVTGIVAASAPLHGLLMQRIRLSA